MTDDIFKLEEYGNFLFISVNGKRVTGKFDSFHRGDLNWIVCVLNGYVNENEQLKQSNSQLAKINREGVKKVQKLAEEKEQLKSRIKELEIINEAQSDAIDGLQETMCHLDLSELNGDVE